MSRPMVPRRRRPASAAWQGVRRAAWLLLVPLLTLACNVSLSLTPPQATAPPSITAGAKPAGPTPYPSPSTATSEPFSGVRVALEPVTGLGRSPEHVIIFMGRTWVACPSTGNVCVLVDGALAGCTDVGGRPTALAADEASGRLYVLDEATQVIRVIEGDAVMATWPAPGALSLTALGGRLWVGTLSGEVAILDPQDGARQGAITLSTGNPVLALAASPARRRLYATTYGSLHAVDVASLTEVAAAEVNGLYRTLAISEDGATVFACEYDPIDAHSHLLALSADSLEVRRRVPTPEDPSAVLTDPRDGRVYLLSAYAGQLVVYDPQLAPMATLEVGLSPRSLALDAQAGLLYVASAESNSIHVVETDELRVADTVALASHYPAMAFDPDNSRLYVAAASSDRILVRTADGALLVWTLRGYPYAVLPLSGEGRIAALTRNPPRLCILSEEGKVLASYPVAIGSGGLFHDPSARVLHAGSLRLELASGRAETVAARVWLGALQAPKAFACDTRRGRLYALAHNGIPGYDGGTVLAPVAPPEVGTSFGRLGVLDAVYDQTTDRFFVASARMGACGLQAMRADDGEEVASISLGGCPTHLAMMPTTGHLWAALAPSPLAAPGSLESRGSLVVVLDAATLGLLAEIAVTGPVDSVAIDLVGERVLVAIGEQGHLLVIQDGATPSPSAPTG